MEDPTDAGPPRRPPRVGFLDRLRQAPATTGLLVTLGVVFVLTALHPAWAWDFAKVDARVRAGDWWRLVTANFLHGSVLHLAVNAYALAMIGPTVEQLYGRVRLLVIFVAGGVAGFAASTVFVRQVSLGASAGLFAMLGVLLGFGLRARQVLPPAARRGLIREILTVAAINLAFGLMVPYVDNAAHVGGFLGGLAISVVLRPRWGSMGGPGTPASGA